MINVEEKKEKILSYLETNGPSLPVRVAKAIEMEPVFASAILSELLSTKKIKLSSMKIGASPLYLVPVIENHLEDHTENLKSIEKDAYLKLKKEKVLIDDEQEPAMRVALRNIKDFAKAFKFNDKIYWKYMFTPDSKIEEIIDPKEEVEEIVKKEVKEISKDLKEKAEKIIEEGKTNEIEKEKEREKEKAIFLWSKVVASTTPIMETTPTEL